MVFIRARCCSYYQGDNRVWCYDTKTSEINIIYDFAKSDNAILSGVDNLTITPAGDVLVAEDGGNMQLIGITSTRI